MKRRVFLKRAAAGLSGLAGMPVARSAKGIALPAMPPDTTHPRTEHPLFRPILGRTARPFDVAATTRFLVGPGARYITGQTINVNGGTYFGV